MELHGQKLFDFLKDRGLIYQSNNVSEVEKMLNSNTPCTFYLGIDPTADAIHIGHLCSLRTFKYLQDAGHHGILVIGGATAHIGDPTGRRDIRAMISSEQIEKNIEQIKTLCKKFIKTEGENPAIILNNNDWMKNYSYINFMRDVGVHFNVNVMLNTDACKSRLNSGGLTFLEMGYSLIQAYDFETLYKKYGCTLQIGGSDQWANMVAGADLIRKKYNKTVETLTTPLLLNAKGEKMGKTTGGALWVSGDKVGAYEFYQYFINIADEDVEKLLKWFSDFDNAKISEIMSGDIREAKKIMAFEVTKLIHGTDKAIVAQKTSEELFGAKKQSENMAKVEIGECESINICDLLQKTNLVSSKSEARRLIGQNGISIDDKKVESDALMVEGKGEVVLHKGKKVHVKVCFVK